MQTNNENNQSGLKKSTLVLNIETVKNLSAGHSHQQLANHTSLLCGQGRVTNHKHHTFDGHTTGPVRVV